MSVAPVRRALHTKPANALVGRWFEAAVLARLPIDLVSYDDFQAGRQRQVPVGARNLSNPVHAVRQLRRAAQESRLVLLHEFLTIPFVPWAATLGQVARRVALVVHHNVQWASRRVRDRLGMKLLLRLGFRFVVPESAAGFSQVLGTQPDDVVATLPFGLPQDSRAKVRDRKIVTVMGGDRKEKGGLDIVDRVMRAVGDRHDDWIVRVASRSRTVLARAAEHGWTALDTSAEASWQACLAESSVLVVDYPAASYYYRPSATICDAISAGAAVVAPDYPVLRAQLSTPCEVGCVLEEGRTMISALETAMAIGSGSEEPFRRYLAHRGPRALAEGLGRFLDAQSGSSS